MNWREDVYSSQLISRLSVSPEQYQSTVGLIVPVVMVLVLFDRGIIVVAQQADKKPTTEIYDHSRISCSLKV